MPKKVIMEIKQECHVKEKEAMNFYNEVMNMEIKIKVNIVLR